MKTSFISYATSNYLKSTADVNKSNIGKFYSEINSPFDLEGAKMLKIACKYAGVIFISFSFISFYFSIIFYTRLDNFK